MSTSANGSMAAVGSSRTTSPASGNVPRANARRSHCPPERSGPPNSVDALLVFCDRGTPTGRRDFAILTLLARLGLRVGEVAALCLEDSDWRRGEIIIRGKGNRHDALPLPADVGKAMAAYLSSGRAEGALDRTVFVRAQAPYRSLTSGGIIQVVIYAGQRCGLRLRGAHRLRHSAATAVLRSGGSLEEVGQLLRHARLATSAIYGKVDVDRLRQIARPFLET